VSNLEVRWEIPGYSRFIRRLASFSRVLTPSTPSSNAKRRVPPPWPPSCGWQQPSTSPKFCPPLRSDSRRAPADPTAETVVAYLGSSTQSGRGNVHPHPGRAARRSLGRLLESPRATRVAFAGVPGFINHTGPGAARALRIPSARPLPHPSRRAIAQPETPRRPAMPSAGGADAPICSARASPSPFDPTRFRTRWYGGGHARRQC
jgi:hypothetical protein